MHIPMNQLMNNTTFGPSRDYHRKFGVHPLPLPENYSSMTLTHGSATGRSWVNWDDDDRMGDK